MLRFKTTAFLAILVLSSAQETESIIPIISLEHLTTSLDSVKQSLADEGEWNSQLRLNGLERNGDHLLSRWSLITGEPLGIDSIVLEGAEELSSHTISQMVKSQIGRKADKNLLIALQKTVTSYSFMDKAGQPFYARSSENRLSAVVPVKTDFSHSIVAAAGLQPSTDGKN
ncbi:MAG TPA: hypothetical protein EYN81_06780, partial [Candidatus Marinimicrobia bacterium]|nr:hypothetical protein [Candidatus Neomarinimicrobiota bacterium]